VAIDKIGENGRARLYIFDEVGDNDMKKRGMGCVLLCLIVMISAVASAVEVVCVQNGALGGDFEYSIMKATLDNGQILYYLSQEEYGAYQMEDVNFDGHDDFVPTIVMGARNFFSVFYLYNLETGQYEPVYTEDQGFCNYILFPEKGYFISSVSDGYRDGETKIYAWEGNTPVLLRSATVGSLHTVEFEDAAMIERWDFGRYEMVIRDYTKETDSEQIIYQQVYAEDDPQVEEHLAMLDTKLWEGM